MVTGVHTAVEKLKTNRKRMVPFEKAISVIFTALFS